MRATASPSSIPSCSVVDWIRRIDRSRGWRLRWRHRSFVGDGRRPWTAVGAFRALNAIDDHGYEAVRVRVDRSLNGAADVNDRLRRLETVEGSPSADRSAERSRDETATDTSPPRTPF